MDPNATLARIRSLSAAIMKAMDGASDVSTLDLTDESNELAEACEALDRWIARGGFLPKAWERK